jgi:hypothetical protein
MMMDMSMMYTIAMIPQYKRHFQLTMLELCKHTMLDCITLSTHPYFIFIIVFGLMRSLNLWMMMLMIAM